MFIVFESNIDSIDFDIYPLQQWAWPGTPPTLVPREKLVEMVKVPSVFAKSTLPGGVSSNSRRGWVRRGRESGGGGG